MINETPEQRAEREERERLELAAQQAEHVAEPEPEPEPEVEPEPEPEPEPDEEPEPGPEPGGDDGQSMADIPDESFLSQNIESEIVEDEAHLAEEGAMIQVGAEAFGMDPSMPSDTHMLRGSHLVEIEPGIFAEDRSSFYQHQMLSAHDAWLRKYMHGLSSVGVSMVRGPLQLLAEGEAALASGLGYGQYIRDTRRSETLYSWIHALGSLNETLAESIEEDRQVLRRTGGAGLMYLADGLSIVAETALRLKTMQAISGVAYNAASGSTTGLLSKSKALTAAVMSKLPPSYAAPFGKAVEMLNRTPQIAKQLRQMDRLAKSGKGALTLQRTYNAAKLAATYTIFAETAEDENGRVDAFWRERTARFMQTWAFMATPAVAGWFGGTKGAFLEKNLPRIVDFALNTSLSVSFGEYTHSQQMAEMEADKLGLQGAKRAWFVATGTMLAPTLTNLYFSWKTIGHKQDRERAEARAAVLRRDMNIIEDVTPEVTRLVGEEARRQFGEREKAKAADRVEDPQGRVWVKSESEIPADAVERSVTEINGKKRIWYRPARHAPPKNSAEAMAEAIRVVQNDRAPDPTPALAEAYKQSQRDAYSTVLANGTTAEKLAAQARLESLDRLSPQGVVNEAMVDVSPQGRAELNRVRELMEQRLAVQESQEGVMGVIGPRMAQEIEARADRHETNRAPFRRALDILRAYDGDKPLHEMTREEIAALTDAEGKPMFKGAKGTTVTAVMDSIEKWKASQPAPRPAEPDVAESVRTIPEAKQKQGAFADLLRTLPRDDVDRLLSEHGLVLRDNDTIGWDDRRDAGQKIRASKREFVDWLLGKDADNDPAKFGTDDAEWMSLVRKARDIATDPRSVPEAPAEPAADVRYQDSSRFKTVADVMKADLFTMRPADTGRELTVKPDAEAGRDVFGAYDAEGRLLFQGTESEARDFAMSRPAPDRQDEWAERETQSAEAKGMNVIVRGEPAKLSGKFRDDAGDMLAEVVLDSGRRRWVMTQAIRLESAVDMDRPVPSIWDRAQRSLSEGGPLDRAGANREIDTLAERTGGQRIAGDAEGENLGAINLHGVPINFRYAKVGEGKAGAIRQDAKGWTVFFDPRNGNVTTIRHELGHAIADMLDPGERGQLKRMGIDLKTDKGQEDFAGKFESEAKLKAFVEDIRGLTPKDQGVVVRAVNKVIDFVNALFGSDIKHVGDAGEIERLAENIEDFRVLRQLAEGERGEAREGMGEREMLAGGQARTANVGMADRAVELERERIRPDMTPEQRETEYRKIADETGWHRVVDGEKWMFEIDDSKMTMLVDRPIIGRRYKLSELIDHPELFSAYPDMAGKVVIPARGSGGNYGPVVKVGVDTFRKTLVHELQHAIQNREKFRRGGSEEAYRSMTGKTGAENLDYWRGELRRMSRTDFETEKDYIAEKQHVTQTIADLNRVSQMRGPGAARKAYLLTTGEALARVSSRRLDMTPEQRKAESPRDTLKAMLTEEGLMREGQQPEDVLISRGGDERFQDTPDRIAQDMGERDDGKPMLPEDITKLTAAELRSRIDGMSRLIKLVDTYEANLKADRQDKEWIARELDKANSDDEREQIMHKLRIAPRIAARLEGDERQVSPDAARFIKAYDNAISDANIDRVIHDAKLDDLRDLEANRPEDAETLGRWLHWRQASLDARERMADEPRLTPELESIASRLDEMMEKTYQQRAEGQRALGRDTMTREQFYFPMPRKGQKVGPRALRGFYQDLLSGRWASRAVEMVLPSAQQRSTEGGLGVRDAYFYERPYTSLRSYITESLFETYAGRDPKGAEGVKRLSNVINSGDGITARNEALKMDRGEDHDPRMALIGKRLNEAAKMLAGSNARDEAEFSIIPERLIPDLAEVASGFSRPFSFFQSRTENHWTLADILSGEKFHAGVMKLTTYQKLADRIARGVETKQVKANQTREEIMDAIRAIDPYYSNKFVFMGRKDKVFTQIDQVREQVGKAAFDKMSERDILGKLPPPTGVRSAVGSETDVRVYRELLRRGDELHKRQENLEDEKMGNTRLRVQRPFVDQTHKRSFMSALNGIVERVAAWETYGDDIRLMEEMARVMQYKASEDSRQGTYKNVAEYYREWAYSGLLGGMTAFDARMYESMPWLRPVVQWTGMLKANSYLAGSLKFLLGTQWTSLFLVPQQTGLMNALRGTVDALVKGMGDNDHLAVMRAKVGSKETPLNYADSRTPLMKDHDARRYWADLIATPSSWMERFTTLAAMNAAEYAAKERNITSQEIIDHLKNRTAATTQSVYARAGRTLGLHSEITRALFPFQGFSFEAFAALTRIGREYKDPSHLYSSHNAAMYDKLQGAAQFVMGVVLVNAIHGLVFGGEEDQLWPGPKTLAAGKIKPESFIPIFGRRSYRRGTPMYGELAFGPEFYNLYDAGRALVSHKNPQPLLRWGVQHLPAAYGIGGGQVLADAIWEFALPLSNDGRPILNTGAEGPVQIDTSDAFAGTLDVLLVMMGGRKASFSQRKEATLKDAPRRGGAIR